MKKCKKYCLNEEKYLFFYFAWIMPLIPMLTLFVLGLINNYFWWLMVILILVWFSLFGFIFLISVKYIIILEDCFIITGFRYKGEYRYDDIKLIEKIVYLNYKFRKPIYKLFIKDKEYVINNNKIIKETNIIENRTIITKEIMD